MLPLGVYQVLFVGYWFWANFVPPQLFPTLNGTLLTLGGAVALQGFFAGAVSESLTGSRPHGAVDAALNLVALGACTLGALALAERAASRRTRRAG